jgi:hypothetical protein
MPLHIAKGLYFASFATRTMTTKQQGNEFKIEKKVIVNSLTTSTRISLECLPNNQDLIAVAVG